MMAWTYQIRTGRLFSPDNQLISTGYAGGAHGTAPEAVNNPDMCAAKNVGPLPPGFYMMGMSVKHPRLGAISIPLTPDPDNDMLGRGDFYIHGDTRSAGCASEGCIIMPRTAREMLSRSDDRELIVVVE